MVSEEHCEIFHYTNGAGIAGIVSSGTLRTTHIEFLNDHEEYRLFFRTILPRMIRSSVERAYEAVRTHPFVTHDVRRAGGERAYKQKKFDELLPVFAHWTREFNAPYVASFCVPETRLVAEHGLLSQWRAYGPDGGYALVFDTARFEKLLFEEGRQIRGMVLFMGDVEYYDDPTLDDGRYPETRKNTETVVSNVANFLISGDSDDLAPIFVPIHQMGCTTKHWGFREEKEVRLVLSQPHPSLVEALPDEHVLKTVHHVLRNGAPVPYMALFENLSCSVRGRLPIKRVLIGPHAESSNRKLATELLLRNFGYIDVPVTVSSIPYRGR